MTGRERIALVRDVSPSIDRCELTHLGREPIDFGRAADQHRQYTAVLEQLGCALQWVKSEPELPDAVFVEDTAVVVDELAIVTRPGAVSRRAEVSTVAAALASYRAVATIEAPGTLDGGDVLRLNRTVYVGRSARTNAAGVAQLARHLNAFGYDVQPLTIRGCLHLKTAVTELGNGLLVANPAWIDPDTFADCDVLRVHPMEPYAANALRIGDAVIHAAAWVRTRERLEERGIRVLPVDASELAKAEAGVTCCSVIFHRNGS
jgi:dimethylargininase